MESLVIVFLHIFQWMTRQTRRSHLWTTVVQMQGLSILTQNQIQIKADHLVLLLPQHADHLPTSHHTNCPLTTVNTRSLNHSTCPPTPPGYTDSMVFTQEKLGNAEHSAPMVYVDMKAEVAVHCPSTSM